MADKTFKRLTKDQNGNFFINSKRDFGSGYVVFPSKEELNSIIDFSWNMTFGGAGEHRKSRTDGSIHRGDIAIFKDVLNGKLGELAFYNYAFNYVDSISNVDLNCYGLGQWDKSDFTVIWEYNILNIAVKTTKNFGNLLLLEQKDWGVIDNKAYYLPNTQKSFYHFIIFCRVKSNIQDLVNITSMSSPNFLEFLEKNIEVECEVTGHINNKDLVSIINNKYIIEKNALLNESVKMDATNYYIQSGCMRVMKRIKEKI